jgi:hypothetical protein
MNSTIQLVLGLIAMCLFSSCGNLAKVGYVTSTHNMPLHKERMEGNLMGAISWNHVEAQASFSPIKYVGLLGNFYGGFPNGQSVSTEYGIGGYYPFGKNFLVEVYGLRINTDIQRNHINIQKFLSEYADATVEALYSKYDGYSLQCDFGIFPKKENTTDRYLHSFGLGVKYSTINFSLFDYKRWEYKRWDTNSQSGGLAEHVTLPQVNQRFLALSGTLRFGKGPINILFQYSHHLSLDGYPPSKVSPPYYQSGWFTLGVELYISRNFRQNIIPKWFGKRG